MDWWQTASISGQAFQASNNVGSNNNNNSQGVGGTAFYVAYCTTSKIQRCTTHTLDDNLLQYSVENERATTVQFDSHNVNESIASFLVVRQQFAWIGYGTGIVY